MSSLEGIVLKPDWLAKTRRMAKEHSMGDRTQAQTNIQLEYIPFLENYFKNTNSWEEQTIKEANTDDQYFSTPKGCICITEDEANYGEMSWVTDVLIEYDIPFDLMWDDGDDYRGGTRYFRPALGVNIEISDDSHKIAIDDLLSVIAKMTDPQDLIDVVKAADVERTAPSPLEEQPIDLVALAAKEVTNTLTK